MHPILFRLHVGSGQFELHSFGVLVATGCLAAILWAQRDARRRGIDEDAVRDLCFWTLILSLIGARVAFVASAGRPLWDECLEAVSQRGPHAALIACTRPLRVWEGGLVFYGGLAAGTATVLFYGRRRGLDPLRTADLIAPSLALGHAIGRLGCLLAGCCFGKEGGGALGLRFGEGSIALQDFVGRGLLPSTAQGTPPLHPTQLYESLGEMALFLVLVRLAPRLRRAGSIALAYIGGYSVVRFVIEVFRGDVIRTFAWPLSTPALNRALGLPEAETSLISTAQATALLAIAAVATIALVRKHRAASVF